MNPATRLPDPLARLIRRLGLRAVSVWEITGRPANRSERRTFRIGLDDGSTVKGRTVRSSDKAREMWESIPLLPREAFPPILGVGENATVEGWVAGEPYEKVDDAVVESAGRILASVHRIRQPEQVPRHDRRFALFLDQIEGWLRELEAGRALGKQELEGIRSLLAHSCPDHLTFGIRHGDFCLENFVRSAGRLHCVDNGTVRPGVLETDLAQTFYRWPMSRSEREVFLTGYTSRSDAASFLRAERFWALAVGVRAAGWRMHLRSGDVTEPLRFLRSYVA